jgi:ribosomal protein L32E
MNEATLTPARKAGRTNHERAERRKEKWRRERAEAELMRDQMNLVLQSPDATPAEKVRAAEILTQIRKGLY